VAREEINKNEDFSALLLLVQQMKQERVRKKALIPVRRKVLV